MADTSIYYESPATSGGVLSSGDSKPGATLNTMAKKLGSGSAATEVPSVGSSMFSALRSLGGGGWGGGAPGFGSTPAFGGGSPFGTGLPGALGSGAAWNLQAQQQGGQGQVVRGPDGRLYVNQGGQWVPLQ